MNIAMIKKAVLNALRLVKKDYPQGALIKKVSAKHTESGVPGIFPQGASAIEAL